MEVLLLMQMELFHILMTEVQQQPMFFIIDQLTGFFPGNTTTVTIYINNPANGVGDTIFVMESGTATTTSNGSTSVLANDTDPDGDALTAVKVTNPSRGTVTLNANGTFSYTHDGSNESTDSLHIVLMMEKLIVHQ